VAGYSTGDLFGGLAKLNFQPTKRVGGPDSSPLGKTPIGASRL
jgi:hypothetical protein